MKILTLNTHSLVEKNYSQKLSDFVSAVSAEQPEIIALQEVNQTSDEESAADELDCYFPCGDHIIRKDNYALNAVKMLREYGVKYHWSYIPIKRGYGIYDEGLALMSLSPITSAKALLISSTDDYENWKTRRILGICTEKIPDEWFFSVHYSWWDDTEEPFCRQWQNTERLLKKYDRVWLMGDFNAPAEIRGESYDMINNSRWYDSYVLAKKKDSGITVEKVIDGWRDKICANSCGMRIDHILCSRKSDIISSEVIFNGEKYPVVSDHFGVMINYKGGTV